MHKPHPCLPHINSALEALYSALGELRAGDDAYRFERGSVDEIIRQLIDVQRDVRFVDRQQCPLYQAEQREEDLAWARQTRPSYSL